MPLTNLTLLDGSTNFKMSTLAEHRRTDSHKCTTETKKKKRKEQATIAGELEVPNDSAISSGLKKMGVKEKEALTKLHDVAYYIALKGGPFADFKDPMDLGKLHGVKFQSGA